VVVRRKGGTLTVTRAGDEILRLVCEGSVTGVRYSAGTLRLKLPGGMGKGELVRLSGIDERKVLLAQQDGEALAPKASRHSVEIEPKAARSPRAITILLDRP
jgi:hypothetical protein